jgi:2-amino-4-hydroxy-6-hydroxymethyldihydropteridine diphosphokinase
MRNGSPAQAAYLAIGSNLGDRARNCYQAIAKLAAHEQIAVTRLSPLIETAPVGGPPGAPPFLNGAIAIETTLGSHALLHELMAIEESLGRTRREKWDPRIIDLDLLLYGDKIVSSDELIVPHPMMHQRSFVLEPLAMIAPDAVHPALQMTVRGLLDSLSSQQALVTV